MHVTGQRLRPYELAIYGNIEKIRLAQEWAATRMAAELKISEKSYYNKLSGKTEWKGTELQKLAALSGKTIEYVLTKTKEN